MEALYEKTEAIIRPGKNDVVMDILFLVMGTYSFFMLKIFFRVRTKESDEAASEL